MVALDYGGLLGLLVPTVVAIASDRSQLHLSWPVCTSTSKQNAMSLAYGLQALLGGQKTCRALQGHVAAFVGLKRYETMTLQQAMRGVRISDIPVFSGALRDPCSRWLAHEGPQLECAQLSSMILSCLRCPAPSSMAVTAPMTGVERLGIRAACPMSALWAAVQHGC